MRRLDFITFLKGFSIFTIVIFHYFQYLKISPKINQVINFGGTGIHLFLLLSGFGLWYSYLNKPIKFIDFIKRRFGKIYIPYVSIVIISALISLLIPIFDNSWYALFGHLLFYKMFDNNIIGSYGYQLWFISTIIQFYLIFYILIYLKKKLKDGWFIGLGFAISLGWSVLIIILGKESLRNWNSFMFQYLWEFMLGILIADYLYNGKLKTNYNTYFIAGISIISIFLYALFALKFGQVGKVLNDIPALLGYSGFAILIYKLNWKFINNFFLFTGKIAFSVYLLHILFLLILKNIFIIPPSYKFIIVVLSLILTYLASFYYDKVINYLYKLLKI